MAEDPSLQYFYLPIVDALKCAEMKVNLFAVLSDITETDHILTIKLVDQSYPAPGLPLNFCTGTPSSLPKIMSNGDIISLHKVVMKIESGKCYCVFNKASSLSLYKGKSAVDLSPYQTYMKYCATDHDIKLLLQLRTWLLDHDTKTGLTDRSLSISSIVIGQVDLICKVLHVCETADGNSILYVWDGTDAPTISFETDLDVEDVNTHFLCPEAPPREVLYSFPSLGTVLRIFDGNLMKELQDFKDGTRWIRICHVFCDLQHGIWKGMLQMGSLVRPLSNEEDIVLHRERLYWDRTASEAERIFRTPWSSGVTGIDHEDLVSTSLRASVANSTLHHQFKCVVRVVSSCPWRAEDLLKFKGKYKFRLTIEDATARIHAFIVGEDGVNFFGDNPARCVLERKMNILLGIPDGGNPGSRNPPWILCCLKSFCRDKSDPWGTKTYRIFGTRLVG